MKNFLSFKYFLVVTFGLFSVLFSSVFYGYYKETKIEKLKSLISESLIQENTANSRHLEAFLSNHEERLTKIYFDLEIEDYFARYSANEDLATFDQKLKREIPNYGFESVSLADENNNIIFSTTQELIGKTILPDESQFKEIKLKEEGFNYFTYQDSDGARILAFYLLVFDQSSGQEIGKFGARISVDDLQKVLPLNLSSEGETYLVTSQGLLITPSKFITLGDRGSLSQIIETDNVTQCFSQHDSGFVDHSFINYSGSKVVSYYDYLPDSDWCLITEKESSVAIYNYFEKMDLIFHLTILLLLFLGSTLGFFVGRYLDLKVKVRFKKFRWCHYLLLILPLIYASFLIFIKGISLVYTWELIVSAAILWVSLLAICNLFRIKDLSLQKYLLISFLFILCGEISKIPFYIFDVGLSMIDVSLDVVFTSFWVTGIIGLLISFSKKMEHDYN